MILWFILQIVFKISLWTHLFLVFRSKHLEVFYKISVLILSQNLRENLPMPETHVNEVTGFQPATILKRRLQRRYFSWILQNFWEKLFTTHLRVTAFSVFSLCIEYTNHIKPCVLECFTQWWDSHLGTCQRSMMEFFCKSS